MNGPRRYYKEKEICEMYGISHNTARKYFGYALLRVGRCVRYDLASIEEHEKKKEVINEEGGT